MSKNNLTNKWSHLKSEIKLRPMLAYRIGIPIDKLQYYLYSTPSEEEILRIEKIIFNDRAEKTIKIRNALSKIVGYRETVEFSEKIGISDSKLRDIIQEKDKTPSYDIINRIEVFLNAVSDFEISIENLIYAEYFIENEFESLAGKIHKVGENLLINTYEIKNLYRNAKKKYDNVLVEEKNKLEQKIKMLKYQQEELNKAVRKLDYLVETFIKD